MSEAMAQDGLALELTTPIATISLQRPEKLNAITPAMINSMEDCFPTRN